MTKSFYCLTCSSKCCRLQQARQTVWQGKCLSSVAILCLAFLLKAKNKSQIFFSKKSSFFRISSRLDVIIECGAKPVTMIFRLLQAKIYIYIISRKKICQLKTNPKLRYSYNRVWSDLILHDRVYSELSTHAWIEQRRQWSVGHGLDY